MTQEENTQQAIRELAEHGLRQFLSKKKVVYESSAYQRYAIGIHHSEWAAIVEKLCAEGFCERRQTGQYKSRPCGAYKLYLTEVA